MTGPIRIQRRLPITVAPTSAEMAAAAARAEVLEAQIRPSVSVRKAAAYVDCDISTIYRALASGALQGHRLGTRSRRVYLDSLQRWQEAGQDMAPAPAPERRRRSLADTASFRAVMARLKAAGV
ncbi:excisionase family DNA-binding protein [Vineibacter terrae]|nr:excisionase family DNA-binding protein [Vineibacter terrae]